MAGIKTKFLDPVKTQTRVSATIRIDFDPCVNLYTDFIEPSDDLGVCDGNISLVHSNKNGAPSGSGGEEDWAPTTKKLSLTIVYPTATTLERITKT